MVDILSEWQGKIFRVAIGPGEYLAEAFTPMVLVGDWLTKLQRNEFNTPTEWSDFDGLDNCEVKDEDDVEIYEGRPERTQIRMWRDFSLKAIVAKDQKTLDAIMEHCHVFPRYDYGTGEIMPGEPKVFAGEAIEQLFSIDDEENPHANDDGYPIQDEWYEGDEDMQKAVTVFRECLQSSSGGILKHVVLLMFSRLPVRFSFTLGLFCLCLDASTYYPLTTGSPREHTLPALIPMETCRIVAQQKEFPAQASG